MSTAAKLQEAGFDEWNVKLGPGQLAFRRIWLHIKAQPFIRNELANLPKDFGGTTPQEQVIALVQRYVAGERLNMGPRVGSTETDLHIMRPPDKNVWELTPPDIRLFGWFVDVNWFVVSSGFFARRVKDHGLYTGIRNEIEYLRNRANLPAIRGGKYQDVLSDRS